MSESDLSILGKRSDDRCASCIVDLSTVLQFQFRNERSAAAVVTGSVRPIRYRQAIFDMLFELFLMQMFDNSDIGLQVWNSG